MHNLGEYTSIKKVWEKYPNGGGEGDFITINGVQFFWDEISRSWGDATSPEIPPQGGVVTGDLKVTGKIRSGDSITVGEYLSKSSGARIEKSGDAEFRKVRVDGLWILDPITNQYIPLSEVGAGLDWDNYTQKTLSADDRLALYDPLTEETHYTTINAINAYIQERIDVEPGGGTSNIEILIKDGTIPPSDTNVWSALRSIQEIEKRSISKTKTDTAEKLIKFKEGIEVGTYSEGTLGSGGALKMENGVSSLEVDDLHVRRRGTFNEAFIKRSEYVGGEQIVSGAGIVCSFVDEFQDFFRCYFDNKDGEIPNLFKVGDLAKAQVFNGVGEAPVDPTPIIPLARTQYIQENMVGLGRNLVKDPMFRKADNWYIPDYQYMKREDGKFITPAHRLISPNIKYMRQTLTLEVGKTYYFKINIRTENVREREGYVGGAIVKFSNTDYNPSSIAVIGTTLETTYSGNFVANSTDVVFTMEAVNTDVVTSENYGLIEYSNPIVSEYPDFEGSIFTKEEEVLFEAKHKWPLNLDYNLPEKLPKREYEFSGTILYYKQNNLIIEGKEFGRVNDKDVPGLKLIDCQNVTIRNCKFAECDKSFGTVLDGCNNVLIEYCEYENVHGGTKVVRASNDVIVKNNHYKNILGSVRGGSNMTTAIQYQYSTGPNFKVLDNSIEIILGEGAQDDTINFFFSNGIPESYMQIKGNWIRGNGGPQFGTTSGGGILLGDFGGSYQIAEDNIVVDSGNYGMGIAGGQHMIMRNNIVYGVGGPSSDRNTLGLSVWDFTPVAEPTYIAPLDINVYDNHVYRRNMDGELKLITSNQPMKDVIPNWPDGMVIFTGDETQRVLPPNLFVRFPYTEPETGPSGPSVLSSFFWRAVEGIGNNYIDLSKTIFASGSDIPKKGDHIFHLGNLTDPERQNAIIISSVGKSSPMWAFYMGINNFSLEGKQTTAFTAKGNVMDGKTTYIDRGYGDISLEDYFNDVSNALGNGDLRMEIKSSAGAVMVGGRNFTSTLTAKVLFYINNITNSVTSWKWTRFSGDTPEAMDSDALWNFGQKDNNTNTVVINRDDVLSGRAIFICDAKVNNQIIRGII